MNRFAFQRILKSIGTILLTLFLFDIPSLAQESPLLLEIEMFLTQRNTGGATFVWKLEAVGPAWEKITDTHFTLTTSQEITNPQSISITGDYLDHGKGFTTTGSQSSIPLFGCCFYRLSISAPPPSSEEFIAVYLDYRDRRYWNIVYSQDHLFEYDHNQRRIKWVDYNYVQRWGELESDQELGIWTIKGATANPDLDFFQPLRINAVSIDEFQLNPRISWEPIQSPMVDIINVYRSINAQGGGPRNWGLLTSLDPTSTSFVDTDLSFGGGWNVFYTIAASNTGIESEKSDTVQCGSGGYMKSRADYTTAIQSEANVTCSLFPNPFNPAVQIEIKNGKENSVSGRLFNVLGQCVKEFNFFVDSEYHIHELKSYDLTSGCYFLQLSLLNTRNGRQTLLSDKVYVLK